MIRWYKERTIRGEAGLSNDGRQQLLAGSGEHSELIHRETALQRLAGDDRQRGRERFNLPATQRQLRGGIHPRSRNRARRGDGISRRHRRASSVAVEGDLHAGRASGCRARRRRGAARLQPGEGGELLCYVLILNSRVPHPTIERAPSLRWCADGQWGDDMRVGYSRRPCGVRGRAHAVNWGDKYCFEHRSLFLNSALPARRAEAAYSAWAKLPCRFIAPPPPTRTSRFYPR